MLSPTRRAEHIDWARYLGGWIIEDDYEAGFRYDREPVGAVQGLAPDRTIHMGLTARPSPRPSASAG